MSVPQSSLTASTMSSPRPDSACASGSFSTGGAVPASLTRTTSPCSASQTIWSSIGAAPCRTALVTTSYLTLHNTHAGHLPLPAAARHLLERAATVHAAALTAWYLTITALITIKFWTYWSTLLPGS